MVSGTDFVDNKSPNDPFPPEWGMFYVITIVSDSILMAYILKTSWLWMSWKQKASVNLDQIILVWKKEWTVLAYKSW